MLMVLASREADLSVKLSQHCSDSVFGHRAAFEQPLKKLSPILKSTDIFTTWLQATGDAAM